MRDLESISKEIVREVVEEILTDLLHPEFGSIYQEPDGQAYLAYQRGLVDGLAQLSKKGILMKKLVFVLKYTDGSYVKRDDSTGPMSSGGYPHKVTAPEEATKWERQEDAAKYGSMSGFRDFERKIYPLEIHYMEKPAIDFSEIWSQCDRRCIETKESLDPEAKHFLDCPIMRDYYERHKLTI